MSNRPSAPLSDSQPWHERKETPTSLALLLERLLRLQAADHAWAHGGAPATYAFRGIGRAGYRISPTLVHMCQVKHDRGGLRKERNLIKAFRQRAWRFLDVEERGYLNITVADTASADPIERDLEWTEPYIWGALAIARHYGVPTRLIDWTMDVFVAAYFAASGDPESDGAVWWFDQSAFEAALNANDKKQWKDWNVPLRRDGSGQRALEKRAFDNGATPWISKLHHYLPFNRMKVQRGFFTASGRLDTPQDEAIDKLGEHVPRGRIVVSKELKRPLLDHLERMGIHAQAIDFPGADAVGCDLARHCCVKNGSRLRQTGRRRRSGI